MNSPAGPLRTIPEALAFWATRTPDAIALLTPGYEPATYRALYVAVERLAAELRVRGLGRQDAIALLIPEGPAFSLSLLAAISVSIAVPMTWPNPEPEHRRILAHPRVRAAVVSSVIPWPTLEPVLRGLPVITLTPGPSGHIGDFGVVGPPFGDPFAEESPVENDIALILHSSGTTGRPKLVPRTHHSIVSTCRSLIETRGLSAADRCLSSARAAYSQGITSLMLPILSGASLIGIAGLGLDALPAWLRACRPTFLSTTPAFLRTLANGGEELRNAIRRSPVQCVHSTAGPLLTDEMRSLEEMFGVPILNGYGMSEAPGIAGERFPLLHRVPGAIGPPWCEVQFVDETGNPLTQHETGEIAVRGPRVFPGYLDDPAANAESFLPGGWFRTGDLGFLDESGYLHLTGRRDETINRGGEKIAPHEVDHVLLGHPAVAEAAVFAVADARLGEDVVAAVVLEPGVTVSERQLRAWMLDRLSPYKAPRRIWCVDHLPRTPTGKVQRGELARRWQEARA